MTTRGESCGCRVVGAGTKADPVHIEFCALHQAASKLRDLGTDVLHDLSTGFIVRDSEAAESNRKRMELLLRAIILRSGGKVETVR